MCVSLRQTVAYKSELISGLLSKDL